jgi:hypothetical protein
MAVSSAECALTFIGPILEYLRIQMNPRLRFLRGCAALLISACACHAQQKDDWQRLSSVPTGAPLIVRDKDSGTRNGEFRSWSADTLALEIRGSEVRVARDRVLEVQSRRDSHRLRNALIGAAIGIAAGAVLNGTLGERLRNEGQGESVQAWFFLGPALAGAGIGAVIASYSTLYRAPRR